jgi:hypothetical protein
MFRHSFGCSAELDYRNVLPTCEFWTHTFCPDVKHLRYILNVAFGDGRMCLESEHVFENHRYMSLVR